MDSSTAATPPLNTPAVENQSEKDKDVFSIKENIQNSSAGKAFILDNRSESVAINS
jgi:hypothetical protein